MNRFTYFTLATTTILAALFAGVGCVHGAERPNIIYILTDDVGYGDVGCYGATHVKTPNIDRLAKEGTRFTDAHATATVCTPTRYAFMTGRYAWRQPGTGIAPGDSPLLIKPGTVTVPSMLKQAGYTTAVVGKWHLGLGDGPTDFNGEIKPGPLELGFDYAFIIPATGDRVPCVFVENHRVVGYDPADPIQVSYGEKIGNGPFGNDPDAKLKIKNIVPCVLVRNHRLGAGAKPFNRNTEQARRLEAQYVFGVKTVLGPESAAHVPADNAKFIRGKVQHLFDQGLFESMRPLRPHMQGQSAGTLVILADGTARLEWAGNHPLLDKSRPHHVMGCRKGGLCRRSVAKFMPESHIARKLWPYRNAGVRSFARQDHRRKLLVINLDRLGGVARPVMGIGDDKRHRFTGVPDEIRGKCRLEGCRPRRIASRSPGWSKIKRYGPDREQVGGGQDQPYAGHPARQLRIDAQNTGVRMGRPDNLRM